MGADPEPYDFTILEHPNGPVFFCDSNREDWTSGMNSFEVKTRGVGIIHEPEIGLLGLAFYSRRQIGIALPKTLCGF